MGWKEYYQERDINSIKTLKPAYNLAAEFLKTLPSPPKNKINILLGGFHPYSGILEEVPSFYRQLYPNLDLNFFYLDQNLFPLTQISDPSKIQSRLENLPFTKNSLDHVFLDLTFNFMNDKQIKAFAHQVSEALSSQGIIIASFTKPAFLKPIETLLCSMKNKVPTFQRGSRQEILALTRPFLKPLLFIETETPDHQPCEIMILTPKDSFPEIQSPKYSSFLFD